MTKYEPKHMPETRLSGYTTAACCFNCEHSRGRGRSDLWCQHPVLSKDEEEDRFRTVRVFNINKCDNWEQAKEESRSRY